MLRKIKQKGSTENAEAIPGVTAGRGRSEGEQRGARKSRQKKPRVRENILTVWVSDYPAVVSWKMRRVIESDAKRAGFDMKSWTGPPDSTCPQPQQGQGSLPHPLSLAAAWPAPPISAGALQGRGRIRAEPARLLSLCDRRGQLKLRLQTPRINLLNKTPTRGLRALGTGVNKGFHARSRNYYYYCSKMQRPSPLLANRGKKKQQTTT